MKNEDVEPEVPIEAPEFVGVAEGDTAGSAPVVAPENVETGAESNDQDVPSDEEQVASLEQTPANVLDGDDNESQDPNDVIVSDVEE